MLSFMRKNAQKIVLTIVVSFVVTTFTGIYFFQSMNTPESTKRVSSDNGIASLGSFVVDRRLFFQHLERFLSQQKEGINLFAQDPAYIELVYYTAWQEALKEAILIDYANSNAIESSKKEQKNILNTLVESTNYASLSDLKKKMKSNGLSSADIKQRLSDYVAYQLALNHIKKSNSITMGQLEQVNTQLNMDYLFIKQDPSSKTASQQDQANQIYQALLKGESIDSLTKKYPNLKQAYLGWKTFYELKSSLKNTAYNLPLNTWSSPIPSSDGFEFVNVLEKKTNKNTFKDKDEALKSTNNKLITDYINQLVIEKAGNSSITWEDKLLAAIDAKLNKNWEKAHLYYQGLISQSPSVPAFYLAIARLYEQQNKRQESIEWYKKSDVIGDIDVSLALPQTNIELGKLFKQNKQYKQASEQFDKAIKRSKSLQQLSFLETVFKQENDKKRLAAVRKTIKTFKEPNLPKLNPELKDLQN